MTLNERYWSHVICGAADDCWLWTGSVYRAGRREGHGRFWVNGRVRSAHAYGLEIASGELAGGRRALHSCDRPGCQNPHHLRWGSHQDNVDDMARRRRSPHLKLSEDQVRLIRSSTVDRKVLASQFGVSPRAITKVRNFETHRFVV